MVALESAKKKKRGSRIPHYKQAAASDALSRWCAEPMKLRMLSDEALFEFELDFKTSLDHVQKDKVCVCVPHIFM